MIVYPEFPFLPRDREIYTPTASGATALSTLQATDLTEILYQFQGKLSAVLRPFPVP